MAKTDWKISDKVKPDDMNAIGEEINGLHDGFIKKSIVIPAGEDLNTYMEEGNYYCPANATVETLLNSPTEEAFHLTVEPHAGVLQTLTTFQPGNLEVYQRNYYFGWGPWNKVPTRDELEEILPLANANAQTYVNERPWQKFKLTEDSGDVKILPSNSNLNNVLAPGFYYAPFFSTNAPEMGTWYVEVISYSESFLMQRATGFSKVYVRNRDNGDWFPWILQTPQPKVWGAF
ncbi:pyocin knob domain-containing protein [Paenibacillus sp. W2I17]|uniref:pyocin knob domain-containing protein n=1 Tax=Paenibacillus sp. W2I17 TaxID=3042311 RepID=UPI0027819A3B|nr:pyocin knob domain-containing protein [Paenibacillus sp. W2I17]MDQ0658747.1 hypothetical protein [Paenibacillus sp. W2I17]